jgi:predicted GNAT family N-acyltransferase
MAKEPVCWCAESPKDGKIYAAVAAWKENGETHWGRFVVFPAARGHHLGTELARTSFDDLFDMGVDKVYMDARDATVKIVCGMGGRVVGESYKFYEGNVTPVVLEKKDYVRD